MDKEVFTVYKTGNQVSMIVHTNTDIHGIGSPTVIKGQDADIIYQAVKEFIERSLRPTVGGERITRVKAVRVDEF